MLSLLIVDDEDLIMAAIRLLVETVPGVHVVGEAANGREALLMIQELRPNIVLADMCMPLLNGIGLTREVRHRYPEVAVVILTGYADEAYVAGALAAGAAGYILKGSDVSELEIAIYAAARTEAYVTPRIAKQVISEHFGGISNYTASAHSHLTSRQRQTLQLIAAGQTNKEIAEFLNISVKTVEKHRAELMQRLGLHMSRRLFAMRSRMTSFNHISPGTIGPSIRVR